MFLIKWFVPIFTLAALISSCGYEELSSTKKQTLTVASDYLHASDSSLFNDFTRKTNIKIKIIHLQSDSISKKVIQDPLNVEFDLIMVSDILTLETLQKKNLLQQFSEDLDKSSSKNYFSITGLDPLVFKSKRNIPNDSTNYQNLSKELWYSKLNEIDLKKIYNCIKKTNQWSTHESALWLHQAELKKLEFPIMDSLAPRINAVGFLSQFEQKTQIIDSLSTLQILLFPDQLNSGILYNYYGAGIICQASNFYAAKQLISYLKRPSQAQIINNKIGIITYDQQTKTGFYKNKRIILNPNPIQSFRFDLKWWNDHLNYAKTMKIEEKKPKPKNVPIADTLLIEN